MITCIKNIKTKKGFQFKKGNSYNYTISNQSMRVYLNQFDSVIIKDEKLLNKYFK